MSLLFMDGFDHYATADMNKKWTTASGGTINPTAGRRNGGALQSPGTNSPAKNIPNTSTLIVGVAFYATSNGSYTFLDFYDAVGGGVQVQFGLNSDGSIFCNRAGNGSGYGPPGGTLIATSSAGAFKFNAWNYLQFKVTISDTVGTVTIKVDNTTVLNASSLDTKNTANAYATQVRLGGIGVGCYFDDLYIADTNGSTNNDFLGDVRIDAYYPNADGTNSAFTCSTGSTHCTLVDESTPNTTDYNDGVNVGDKDTYNFANMVHNPSAIFGSQLCLAVAKDDSGARSVKPCTRSGGANYSGAATALSTSQLYVTEIRETDPATSAAWTKTNLNAAEFGAEVA
jgi:hypothetical protein